MTKRNILFLLLISLSVLVYGQGELDAYRLSLTDLQGTARGQAMGGAFGALGGDMTGTMINPAGVAVYRSSEIGGTLDLSYTKNDANWQGIKTGESRYNFALNNISLVYYSPMGKDMLKNINFGFSYHRLNNFSNKRLSRGSGMSLSLLDYIAHTTNGYTTYDFGYESRYRAPWLSTLAWDGYLINSVPNTTEYVPNLLEKDETVDPWHYVEEKGYIDAYDFSLGFNFSHKFYWGATFTVTTIDYTMDSYYTETFEIPWDEGGNPHFDLDNSHISEGSGYQLKTGIIWRPLDALRIGVSYHSPTWYHMTDYYKAWVDSDFGDSDAQTPDNGRNDYRFQSPYSWTFSLAGVIGTKAILSVDYEIKDYTTMNLQDGGGHNYTGQNDAIDQDFKAASTLRVGAEYKFTPQFSFRLGYAWMENPYTSNLKNDNLPPALVGTIPHYVIEGDKSYYTGGFGYRFTPEFYIDFAFVHSRQTSDLYYFPSLYDYDGSTDVYTKTANSIPATIKSFTNRGLLTLGYKF